MLSPIALYRKYRPSRFLEIEGQEFIVRTLMNSITNNKIYHAYILSGTRGIGKTSIAKIFSKSINCLNNNNGDCCNLCKNCELINKGSIDVVEIDAASNNSVDDIRTLIEQVVYLPFELKYKVYILDEAHMLSNQAWNALLKTIEEPPSHSFFVFATTEFNKIPLTIKSRCQKFILNNLSTIDLEKMMKKVCAQEKIKIEDNASKKIIQLANGSARDCLTILGQLDIFTNSNIKLEDVNSVFGLIDINEKLELIKNIVQCKYDWLIQKINKFESDGVNFFDLAINIIKILYDKLIYEKTNNISLLKELSDVNINFINISSRHLIKLIEIWQSNLELMKNSSDQRFYFELSCLSGIKLFDFESLNSDFIYVDENEDNEIVKPININDVLTNKTYGSSNSISKNNQSNSIDIKVDNNDLFIVNKDYVNSIISKAIKIDQYPKQIEVENNLFTIEKSEVEVDKNTNDKNKENCDEIIVSDENIFNLLNNDDYQDVELPNIKNDVYDESSLKLSSLNKIKTKELNQDKSKIIDSFKQNLKEVINQTNKLNIKEINNVDNQNEFDVFCRIADNANNDLKVNVCNKFNNFKGKIGNSIEENYLVHASRVLIVSNNGMVVVFDDEIHARSLAENFKEANFLKYVTKKFGKTFYVLSINKKVAKEYGNRYKQLLKENHKKKSDVDINFLLEIIKNKSNIKNLALSMLNDVFEESEN